MMLFKDSGIFSPKIDANRNLCYTVKVKNLDYTPQMADLIFSLYEDGKTADIELI